MEDRVFDLQPGSILNGRYEIIRCLGIGSTGIVYACRNREVAEQVNAGPIGVPPLLAMKVLYSRLATNPQITARFFNEIEALYTVSHEHVIRIVDYFRDEDYVAYTMEYLDGCDLGRFLEARRRLPISTALRYFSQICAGIAAIHRAGVVHRDLKPENIFITKAGKIKIFDFGISRILRAKSLTEHGSLVGTLDYLSPEYLADGHLDHRSDIYAAGLLLYLMICGRLPWDDGRLIDAMIRRVHSAPTPVCEHRSDCPKELGAIVDKALHRDLGSRYQSASHIVRDLRAFARSYIHLDPAASLD